MARPLQLPRQVRQVSLSDDRRHCRCAHTPNNTSPVLRKITLLCQLINPLLKLARSTILPLLELHNLVFIQIQFLQCLSQLVVNLGRLTLYPLQSLANTSVSKQTPGEGDESMTHKVDAQYQTPGIRQRHDQALESIHVEAVPQKQVYRTYDTTPSHNEPIPAIAPKRILQSCLGLSIPTIAVLA